MGWFNNPTFWECVGGVLIAAALSPIVYVLFVAARVAYDAWKHRDQPSASLDDPVFGRLLHFDKVGCWEGRVAFTLVESDVSILVDAAESGPTERQRALYTQVEQRYDNLLPDIQQALTHYVDQNLVPEIRAILSHYVDHIWKFELLGLAVSNDTGRWTADYLAIDEEDGDMSYSVEVVNWVVGEVTGSD